MKKANDTPKPSKYDQRREAVMHAAAAVFAEKGFHGASTHDIADRLDMKQGSLYYYFPSKEAALEAVCEYGVIESIVRLKQVLDADLTLPEKIHGVIHNQLHGLKTRCDHRIVFVQQRRFLPAEPRQRIREHGAEYRRLLVDMFKRAQHRREIASGINADLAARALIGLCDSVAPWYQQDDSLDIDAIVNQYTRVFCSGIQPEKSPE